MAAGKVKIKEMGLRDGHPEKEGILVNLTDLVGEVRKRILRKSNLEEMVKTASGLKVVGGIRAESESTGSAEAIVAETSKASEETIVDATNEAVSETEKPAGDSLQSPEVIGAIPAS